MTRKSPKVKVWVESKGKSVFRLEALNIGQDGTVTADGAELVPVPSWGTRRSVSIYNSSGQIIGQRWERVKR